MYAQKHHVFITQGTHANPIQSNLDKYKSQLRSILDLPDLQFRRVLLQHVFIVVLEGKKKEEYLVSNTQTPTPMPTPTTQAKSTLTFQNCFEASFPATRLRIFAPPGCSSTKFVTS